MNRNFIILIALLLAVTVDAGKFRRNANECSGLKDCVECQVYKKGLLKDPKECESKCTIFVASPVELLKYNVDSGEHLCTFYDEDECRYQFVYNRADEKNGSVTLQVRAQQNQKCPRH